MGLGPFSSRPVAVSPPFWGWVCFGGLTGVVVPLCDAWRGFPRWVGLLAALLEVYLSIFEQLVSTQGTSASTPLFPRGKGRSFCGWLGGTGVASGGVPSLTHGVSLALEARCPSLPSRLVRHP